MLDDIDDSEPLPLDDPDPDELSRFFFLPDVRLRSGRDKGGEFGFFRFSDGIGEANFFSIKRGRARR